MKRRSAARALPTRGEVRIAVVLMIAAIAVVDLISDLNPFVVVFYILPILFAAEFLHRQELVVVALSSAILTEHFNPSSWGPGATLRFFTSLAGFLGIGLLLAEINARRFSSAIHAGELADQKRRREETEEQLRGLIEGSPAAILTIDPEGRILVANAAAHEMLACENHSLHEQPIEQYLPAVVSLQQASKPHKQVRTSIECTGYRRTGEAFLAHIWVSSFGPQESSGLSVVVFDSSDELCGREEEGLRSLTASARVIMGSFWHETRNVCTALRMTANSLKLIPGVVESEEIVAMMSLIEGLERLAVAELRPDSEQSYDCASLHTVLDRLRIVIEHWFQDSQIGLTWIRDGNLPIVRGDQHAILQVFLNLARNALRVLEGLEQPQVWVEASTEGAKVVVRFRNNGPPIAQPELLFKPFQEGAAGRGIGLYVSRAIMRSFGGDLLYETVPEGCCFTVALERGATWVMFKSQVNE